jgi:dGTPase
MREVFDPHFAHYKQSLRVVEKLERGGKGLNLTWEVRDGILNHTGKCMASTLEGVIIKFADRIAYINHDIDDACRAGILCHEDIPKDLREILGETHSERINTMVTAVIAASTGKNEISMLPEIQTATDRLRTFMFEAVYTNPIAKAQDGRAKEMLGQLFHHFVQHPEKMPELYRNNVPTDGVERCVCDFIAGMTDRYAIDTYKDLFIPRVWSH